MEHQPHLGIADIGISILGGFGESWYVHFNCPKAAKNMEDIWHILSLDCYSMREKLHCAACDRRFGKRALESLKARTGSTRVFNSLENMQKYAAENDTKVYHAHAGFKPPKLEPPPPHL